MHAPRRRHSRAPRDGDDHRGTVRRLRQPGDALSRRPRPRHADRHADAPCRRGRGPQGRAVLRRAPRPLRGAGGRRLRGTCRRRDRRVHGRRAQRWGGTGFGTVPHAAIAAYGGDTALAAARFAEHIPQTVQLVVLVDFENDSVKTALEVARSLGPRLYGVRLDTSATLVDESVVPVMGQFDPRGVNARLVHNVRNALDDAGFPSVRIVASGASGSTRFGHSSPKASRWTPTASVRRWSRTTASSISRPTSC